MGRFRFTYAIFISFPLTKPLKLDIYGCLSLEISGIPQVETGALFLATNLIRSPDQIRYESDQEFATCFGDHKV